MKHIQVSLLFILFPLVFFAQDLRGDANNAVLYLTITNQNGEPLATKVKFYNAANSKEYSTYSNTNGLAQILIPINQTYSAYTDISDNKFDFNIPNYPRLALDLNLIFDDTKRNQLHPTPTYSVINFLIKNSELKAIQENFVIRSLNSDFELSARTNTEGKAQVLVPYNQSYTISFDGAPNYAETTIPQTPFYVLDKGIFYEGSAKNAKHPTTHLALFNISYWDLNKKPVANEVFYVEDIDSKKKYEAFTNSNGKAQVLVPIGRSYSISAKYDKNFAKYTVPNKEEKHILEFDYTSISSIQREKQQAQLLDEAKRIQAEWEKQQKAIDSIQKIQQKEWKIEQERLLREEFRKDSIAQAARLKLLTQEKEKARKDSILRMQEIKNNKELIALQAQLKRQKDSLNIVENIRLENVKIARKKLCDSLEKERIIWVAKYETSNNIWGEKTATFKIIKRNGWKKQLFVVDVTGSMTPYAIQMKNWFILNLAEQDTAHFVFFNDGDGLADEDKIIGATGGIYTCKNCDILRIENEYKKASKYCGEDIPENDMEALISATNSITNYKELILLADNNSKMRDYSLLKDFDIPVRIILCGVKNNIINEQYLDLAYETKGSVHTIELDIQLLKRMKNMDNLYIGTTKYVYINGRFLRAR